MNDYLFILADMIKQHRIDLDLKLHHVAIKSNLTIGTLSKIENGKHKPEYRSLKAIASVLKIPYNLYVRAYINLEKNIDILQEILKESVSKGESSSDIFADIIGRYIEVADDSYTAIENVYNIANDTQNSSVKLLLHKSIIDYSRSRGIMSFLAKSLFQVYLIERNDFTKLQSTYQSGSYILNYIDMLNSTERILLHYKLAVHAYTLRLFDDSIKLCKLILSDRDVKEIDMQLNVCSMLRDSYFGASKYDLAEKCFEELKKYPSYDITENDRLFMAIVNSKKGYNEIAEVQFQECLDDCSEEFMIHVANEYISFLLETNQLSKVGALLLKTEEGFIDLIFLNPQDRKELAWFYQQKGDYYARINAIVEAINSYNESAFEYAKIDDINSERDCLKLMFYLYRNNKHMVDSETSNMVESYYERFEKEGIV